PTRPPTRCRRARRTLARDRHCRSAPCARWTCNTATQWRYRHALRLSGDPRDGDHHRPHGGLLQVTHRILQQRAMRGMYKRYGDAMAIPPRNGDTATPWRIRSVRQRVPTRARRKARAVALRKLLQARMQLGRSLAADVADRSAAEG